MNTDTRLHIIDIIFYFAKTLIDWVIRSGAELSIIIDDDDDDADGHMKKLLACFRQIFAKP